MAHSPLIYLYGYPGVGKNTVAQQIEAQSGHIAIQNHLISNAFRHVIAKQPKSDYAALEPLVKHHTMKAWLNFLEFVDKAADDKGLIFTSVLYQNDPGRVEYFDFIRDWAHSRRRPFFPVRIVCSADEALRRAQSPNRNAEFKLNDPVILDKLMRENTLLSTAAENFLELDTTSLPADQAAAAILAHVARPPVKKTT